MPDRLKLEQSLATLHEELKSAEQLDPEIERQLREAMAEIRIALGGEPPDAEREEAETSLVDRLSELRREFEQSHPTLSGMVGSVIDTLSRMGI